MAVSIEQIHESVYRIATPFGGTGMVFLHLIKGDRVALVDTGGAGGPTETLQPALAQIGMSFSDVDLILNTHAHLDHIGGNAEAKRLSGAEIFLPAIDLPMAQDIQAEVEYHTAPLRALELHPEFIQMRADHVRENVTEAAAVDHLLSDGDVIDLGAGVEVRVVAVPGHTPGHVAYYWDEPGLFVTGDAVQGIGARPGSYPYYFNAADYRNSLTRLAALGVEALCMSHAYQSGGAQINNPTLRGDSARAFIQESIAVADTIHRAVEGAVKAHPGAGKQRIARVALDELIHEIPQLRHRLTGMPLLGGPTLLAHIEAAQAGTYPY